MGNMDFAVSCVNVTGVTWQSHVTWECLVWMWRIDRSLIDRSHVIHTGTWDSQMSCELWEIWTWHANYGKYGHESVMCECDLLTGALLAGTMEFTISRETLKCYVNYGKYGLDWESNVSTWSMGRSHVLSLCNLQGKLQMHMLFTCRSHVTCVDWHMRKQEKVSSVCNLSYLCVIYKANYRCTY